MNYDPVPEQEIYRMAVAWWREKVSSLFTHTVNYYRPGKLTDQQLDAILGAWLSDLQEFPIPAIRWALQQIRKYGEPFFPKVSEIVEQARLYERDEASAFASGTGDRRHLPEETQAGS